MSMCHYFATVKINCLTTLRDTMHTVCMIPSWISIRFRSEFLLDSFIGFRPMFETRETRQAARQCVVELYSTDHFAKQLNKRRHYRCRDQGSCAMVWVLLARGDRKNEWRAHKLHLGVHWERFACKLLWGLAVLVPCNSVCAQPCTHTLVQSLYAVPCTQSHNRLFQTRRKSDNGQMGPAQVTYWASCSWYSVSTLTHMWFRAFGLWIVHMDGRAYR